MARVHRDTLAIPDYEHLPLDTLQYRIRSLTREQVRELIAYEEAHAQRARVLGLMHQRIRELEERARSSPGRQAAAPETPPPAAGDSPANTAGGGSADVPPPARPSRPGGTGTGRRT